MILGVINIHITMWVIIWAVGLAAFPLFGFLGHLIFKNRRFKKGKRGVNTVFYYLTILQYYLLRYTVVLGIELLAGIGSIMLMLFTGKEVKTKKASDSEMDSDIQSFINNHVSTVIPNSQERYSFELREAYTYFCSSYNYNPKNRKLAEKFEKKYYKRVFS